MQLFIIHFLIGLVMVMTIPVKEIYQGIISRNEGQPFLIRRPFSDTAMDAVSEGVGYGLLLALVFDDQTTFNRILEGAEATMWTGEYYNWRIDKDNNVIGYGAAVDAEEDIAFSCIMASYRVASGNWTDYRDGFYTDRAHTILEQLWLQGIQNHIVRPGYGWGGEDFVNPSYFAPAWYRVFQDFDVDSYHDWFSVIDRCYHILQFRDSALIPDWMRPDGQSTDRAGENAYGNGHFMYKDAIRILWRIGTDMVWHGDVRAESYIRLAYEFMPDIRNANFFQMDGSIIPDEDDHPRHEHSPITIGMWMIPILLLGTVPERIKCETELMSFYLPGSDHWGLPSQYNDLYFDQFLAEFGALFLTDHWNVLPS
jgi:hypothetical protein